METIDIAWSAISFENIDHTKRNTVEKESGEQVLIESWNHPGKPKYYTMPWGPYPKEVVPSMLAYFKNIFGEEVKLIHYAISDKIQN